MQLFFQLRMFFLNFEFQLIHSKPHKWQFPMRDLVKNDSEGPQINSLIVFSMLTFLYSSDRIYGAV